MILVTGHMGFIGQHFVSKLNSLGIKWVGFDLVNGQDIRNKLALEKVFDTYPIQAVVHMAAIAGARRGEAYPQDYFDTNVIGSENVARTCEKFGVRRLIAFSSSSAKSCINTYGITKHAMELMLLKTNIPILHIVRPFNVFGENGRADQVIGKWQARIEANMPIEYHGNLKRNYTYVGDIVNGVLNLLSLNEEGKFTHDFGNPKATSLSTILGWFKEKYPDMKVEEKPMIDDVTVSPEGTFNCKIDLTKEFI